MYCVIMAGGSGTRFWPYSRHARPKQLLSIVGEDTMLQMTVNRLKKIPQVKDIFIVTRYDLADTIGEEISGVSPDNIIVEPSGKIPHPASDCPPCAFWRWTRKRLWAFFPPII